MTLIDVSKIIVNPLINLQLIAYTGAMTAIGVRQVPRILLLYVIAKFQNPRT